MDNDQTETTYRNNKMYIYIVGIVAVVFVIIALTLLKENQRGGAQTQNRQVGKIQNTSTQGSMTIVTKDDKSRYPSASSVVLQVVADSQNQEIVGYDALVTYDTNAFDFVSSASLVKEFTAHATDQKEAGVVSVTATKLPQATASSTFTGVRVLELTFRPKTAGNYTFSVVPSHNKETTKLVNEQTTILTPSVGAVSVEIY